MRQRSYLVVKVGDLLEIIAPCLGVYGVYRLAGLGWALIAAFVLLVAVAEWVVPTSVARVPLPLRPHPQVRMAERRQALSLRWRRTRSRWRRGWSR